MVNMQYDVGGKAKKKKPFFLRWWFILLAIIVVGVIILNSGSDGEKIVWQDIVLSDILPEPPVEKGKIHTNTAEELWVDITDVSDKQFNDYIEACKVKGFTVDAQSDSNGYEAYNAQGYKLSLSHWGSDADMRIEVTAPMEMTTIAWPTSVAGEQLPAPKSTIGKFSVEHEDSFFVYVGNTTKTEYAEYVNTCSEMGFNVDYSKGDDYYSADNAEGWHVNIQYVGNNVMSIDIDAPSQDEGNNETPEKELENDTPNNSGLDPDFKAAMDSYEAFVDEYVAFMKKYINNPDDLSLALNYTEYISKNAEMADAFAKWADEGMNAAETTYYLEVQVRVNKKMLEVAG